MRLIVKHPKGKPNSLLSKTAALNGYFYYLLYQLAYGTLMPSEIRAVIERNLQIPHNLTLLSITRHNTKIDHFKLLDELNLAD